MSSGSKRLSDTVILSVTTKELMDILAKCSLNLLSPKELFLYLKFVGNWTLTMYFKC